MTMVRLGSVSLENGSTNFLWIDLKKENGNKEKTDKRYVVLFVREILY